MKRNQKLKKRNTQRNAWNLISYALMACLVIGLTFGLNPIREAIAETMSGVIPPTGDGSITIYLQDQDDTGVAGAKVYLYYVAEWNTAGSWDLAGDFASAEADLSQAGTAAGMETAVNALRSYADRKGISGAEKITNAQGIVTYSNLAEGLYMVVQDGMEPGAEVYRDFTPFLISVPQIGSSGESQNAVAYPKTEKETETSTGESSSIEETSTDEESSSNEDTTSTEDISSTETTLSMEETDVPPSSTGSGTDGSRPQESTASGETGNQTTEEETVPNTGGEDDPQLPITGMVVWPITVFSILGLVLVVVGWADNRICKAREKH